jgi:AAA+ ATPase superfamily predicted ATPase
MDAFVGRRSELSFLEKQYRSAKSAFVPIYGRRRVGKSALILQFLKNRPGVYFVAKRLPAPLLRREFATIVGAAIDDPLFARVDFGAWDELFETSVSRLAAADRKIVLALDEFQWLAEASPEIPSVLQHLWDRRWQHSGRIALLLCGSYLGFMEREVLGKESPLFGRRTGQILLRPFSYLEAALFCPSYSLVDQARTYFICGGIPLYLQSFSSDRSLEMNIVENILGEYAPLFREADFLVREELRDPASYYAILSLLGKDGPLPQRDLARQTGLGLSIQHHLHHLVEMGLLARRFPLSGARASKQALRYELEDPLLRFWFRFVHPNTSFIARTSGEAVFKDRIRPELTSYFGSCFERLCREAMPILYAREGVMCSIAEIGRFWSPKVEIDLVGIRGDDWIDLGECKWGTVRSPSSVAHEIEAKIPLFPNPRNATIARRVFTRERVRIRGASNVRWHSLADLYETP